MTNIVFKRFIMHNLGGLEPDTGDDNSYVLILLQKKSEKPEHLVIGLETGQETPVILQGGRIFMGSTP